MRYVVTVFVLAILALGVWFARDRGELVPANGESRLAPMAVAANAQPAGAAVPAAGAREEAPASAVPTARTGTGSIGEVLVVRFGSNAPVAGAEVVSMPPDIDWNTLTPELSKLSNSDPDAFLERVGVRATTGADGRCRVAFGARGVRVVARHAGDRAEDYLQKDTPQPLVLTLRADRTLHVRVLLADGSPAPGTQVLATSGGATQAQFLFGATDARGCLTKQHVQEVAGDAATCELAVLAKFNGGGGTSPAVAVDALDPPPEVLLRLPPCGSVTVHVRDAEGKAIDPALLGSAIVRLGMWAERPSDRNAENDGVRRTNAEAQIDARGDATFAAVALDQFVMVTAGLSMRSPVVAGPTLREPRVEIVLQESSEAVVLTGVLHDTDDRALVGGYNLTLHSQRGMSGSNGQTDANGRFRLELGLFGAGQRATIAVSAIPTDRQPFAIELPPRDVTRGVNDLGTLRLAPFSLLASGRFVGEGLAGPPPLQMWFERQRDGHWQKERNIPQPTWSGTSFTVRSGIPAGTPMRLSIGANSFLPVEPIEFAAGAQDLEVTLRRGGSATAVFLTDADVPVHDLQLALRRNDPPADWEPVEAGDRLSDARAADGTVRHQWRGLAAGTYQLDVLCPGRARPIVTIEAIAIADGECNDPRLAGIDLRGRLRTLRIRATAADGSAVVSADAFVVARGPSAWNGYGLGHGEAAFVVTEAVDLLVVAPGHRAAFVDGVSESRTIALEATAPTQLVFALPAPVPQGLRMRVRLQPQAPLGGKAWLRLDHGRGMRASDFFEQDLVVDADGTLSVRVRCPGMYRLSAVIGTDAKGSPLDVAPRELELPASGDVAVRIDAASWSRAMQKLGR